MRSAPWNAAHGFSILQIRSTYSLYRWSRRYGLAVPGHGRPRLRPRDPQHRHWNRGCDDHDYSGFWTNRCACLYVKSEHERAIADYIQVTPSLLRSPPPMSELDQSSWLVLATSCRKQPCSSFSPDSSRTSLMDGTLEARAGSSLSASTPYWCFIATCVCPRPRVVLSERSIPSFTTRSPRGSLRPPLSTVSSSFLRSACAKADLQNSKQTESRRFPRRTKRSIMSSARRLEQADRVGFCQNGR